MVSGTILSLVIAGIYVLVWGFFNYFLLPGALPATAPSSLVPAPRLQVDPHRDFQQLDESQRKVLDSYGWVNRPDAVVRIPIDRAMDLVVERGLPEFKNPPQPREGPR
jgi:hypothetical protein